MTLFLGLATCHLIKRTSVYYLDDDDEDEDDEDEDEDGLLWLFTVFGKMPFAI